MLVFWFWREIVFGATYVLRVQYSCAVVLIFRLWREMLLRPEKKGLVVCLAGARSLLRPEKKRYSRLSGGCTIIITTGKKRYSCLSGKCAIIITTGKKKDTVVSVWRVCDPCYNRKKKDTVVCLVGAQSLL